jgi:hypothetical protein
MMAHSAISQLRLEVMGIVVKGNRKSGRLLKRLGCRWFLVVLTEGRGKPKAQAYEGRDHCTKGTVAFIGHASFQLL